MYNAYGRSKNNFNNFATVINLEHYTSRSPISGEFFFSFHIISFLKIFFILFHMTFSHSFVYRSWKIIDLESNKCPTVIAVKLPSYSLFICFYVLRLSINKPLIIHFMMIFTFLNFFHNFFFLQQKRISKNILKWRKNITKIAWARYFLIHSTSFYSLSNFNI